MIMFSVGSRYDLGFAKGVAVHKRLGTSEIEESKKIFCITVRNC